MNESGRPLFRLTHLVRDRTARCASCEVIGSIDKRVMSGGLAVALAGVYLAVWVLPGPRSLLPFVNIAVLLIAVLNGGQYGQCVSCNARLVRTLRGRWTVRGRLRDHPAESVPTQE